MSLLLRRPRGEELLLTIIKTGLYLSLLLAFIVSDTTMFPYLFGRAIFFQILVEILLIPWVILLVFYPLYRPKLFLAKVKGQSSWWQRFKHAPEIVISWAITIFLLWSVLSAVLGLNPARSFWGPAERMTGVFTLLHFGLYYFMLISVLPRLYVWRWFLRGLVLVALINSAMVVYQGLVLKIFRPWAWFGGASIAGTFLLFCPFIILIWYFSERELLARRSRWVRLFFLIFMVASELLVTAAIFVNGTRSVWLGLMFAGFVGFGVTPYFLSKSRPVGDPAKSAKVRWRLFYWGYVGAVAVLIAFLFTIMSGSLPAKWYTRIPALDRVRDLAAFGVGADRLLVWQEGLKAVFDHPITGYGPENFQAAFNRHYNPQIAALDTAGFTIQFDKTHNQPLEFLVCLGWLGLFVYLGIFAVMFYGLMRKRGALSLVLSLFLLAYFTQNLFTFDTPISYWLLFIFCALIYTHLKQPLSAGDKFAPTKTTPAVALIFLFILLPISASAIYFLNLRPFLASRLSAQGHVQVEKAPLPAIFNPYYAALQLRPVTAFDLREAMVMDIFARLTGWSKENEPVIAFIIQELKKNSPDDYYSQLMLGQLYNLMGDKDAAFFNDARIHLLKAADLANSRYQVHSALAVAYLGLGEFRASAQAIEQAMRLGYKPSQFMDFMTLGLVYGQLNDLAKSLLNFEQALSIAPSNTKVLGALSALYKERGEIKKARELAGQILAIDPTMRSQVEKFLSDLPKE